MWRSLVARLNGVQEAGSSTLPTQTTSEQVSLVPIFYFKKSVTCSTVPPLSHKGTAFAGTLRLRRIFQVSLVTFFNSFSSFFFIANQSKKGYNKKAD